MAKKRVIDKRIKEKFLIDDAYLNGMAKKCGWQATLVYICLCRHASKEQECFPSIKLMQEKLGVGRNTIIKGIKNLEKDNIINTEKERMKNGKWQNNTYILIDKSEWKGYQVPVEDTAPSPRQNTAKSLSEHSQVPVEDIKETHIRKHIEGVVGFADNVIKSLIGNYYDIIKEQYGYKIKITIKDVKNLKSFLGGSSEKEIKAIFQWYVNNPKFKEFPNLSSAISAHSVNLFRSEKNRTW